MQAHEIRRVDRPQQPAAQSVVRHRIHARRLQHIEQRHPVGHGAGAKLVDVTLEQIVRMFVVAAEHTRFRMLGEQGPEFLEVFRGRAFADENFLTEREFLPRLVDLETFVVGFDSGRDIGLQFLAPQSGRMAVNALPVTFRDGQFFHHQRITMDHAGEVHHFGEIDERFVAAEFLDLRRSERGSGRLEVGRGHARGNAEMNLHRRLLRQFLHVAHAFEAEDVRDFMRIRNRARRAMDDRDAGKLRRREHGTLDVDMGINEPRTQIAGLRHALVLADRGNFSISHLDHAGKNAAVGDVEDLAADEHGRGSVQWFSVQFSAGALCGVGSLHAQQKLKD